MVLINTNYKELAKAVKENNKKIVVYGVGMIGKIIVPYLIEKYNLEDNLTCFVDADLRKRDSYITICNKKYFVRTPDYLNVIDNTYIVLITNSKFFPIINYLDKFNNLKDVEGYILPIMQLRDLEKADSIKIERRFEKIVIPKKIHYCWFGEKDKPEFLKKCIESWKRMCPDYEIIEWNEYNYDVRKYTFTKEAYENKKYGFITDVARFDILYEHGGIYMDTDVTLLKNLDDLLCQDGFVGTEKWGNINTGGGCGFIPKHPMVKKILEYRSRFHFVLDDGTFNIETNGVYETKMFLEQGFKPDNTLQVVGNVTVYPSYITHPYDYMSCELQKKDSTVSVHHFYGGWMEENDRKNRENTQKQYDEIIRSIERGGI